MNQDVSFQIQLCMACQYLYVYVHRCIFAPCSAYTLNPIMLCNSICVQEMGKTYTEIEEEERASAPCGGSSSSISSGAVPQAPPKRHQHQQRPRKGGPNSNQNKWVRRSRGKVPLALAEERKDEEEWEEWLGDEEEIRSQMQTQCLLCEERHPGVEAALQHMQQQHGLDLKTLLKSLTEYNRIRLVNFVRHQVSLARNDDDVSPSSLFCGVCRRALSFLLSFFGVALHPPPFIL